MRLARHRWSSQAWGKQGESTTGGDVDNGSEAPCLAHANAVFSDIMHNSIRDLSVFAMRSTMKIILLVRGQGIFHSIYHVMLCTMLCTPHHKIQYIDSSVSWTTTGRFVYRDCCLSSLGRCLPSRFPNICHASSPATSLRTTLLVLRSAQGSYNITIGGKGTAAWLRKRKQQPLG